MINFHLIQLLANSANTFMAVEQVERPFEKKIFLSSRISTLREISCVYCNYIVFVKREKLSNFLSFRVHNLREKFVSNRSLFALAIQWFKWFPRENITLNGKEDRERIKSWFSNLSYLKIDKSPNLWEAHHRLGIVIFGDKISRNWMSKNL